MLTCGAGPAILHPDRAEVLRHARLFDHWVLNTIVPSPELSDLGHYCQAEQIPLRGSHLFRWVKGRDWTWHVAQAEQLAALLPHATAWDAIHEYYPMRCRGYVPESWPADCLNVAMAIAPDIPLFVSEYRLTDPQRLEFTVTLIEGLWAQGYPIAGLSIQLQSNLLTLQPLQLRHIQAALAPLIDRGLRIHCHEMVVWQRGLDRHELPLPLEERIQSHVYGQFMDFARAIGADLYGPWDIWDGGGWKHPKSGRVERQGIWREDWSPKPAFRVFEAEAETPL